MSKIFDLWNTVAGAFGPSGREDAVRETIAEIAGAYIDDVNDGRARQPYLPQKRRKERQKATVCRAYGLYRRGCHLY